MLAMQAFIIYASNAGLLSCMLALQAFIMHASNAGLYHAC
jgi:hypothetical protein